MFRKLKTETWQPWQEVVKPKVTKVAPKPKEEKPGTSEKQDLGQLFEGKWY